MGRSPICPLCGQPVKAKDRHIIVTLKDGRRIAEQTIRHTMPCPKPEEAQGGVQ